MDENKQQEFISWLADKLQAQDQDDLQKKLKTLGDDGIKQAYDQFMSESSDQNAEVPVAKQGGRLNYLKCLQAFAKGGAIAAAKCGCGGKMEDGGMLSKKIDKRKDANTKEKRPGAKQWIGDSGKKEHTAVTKITKNQQGGSLQQFAKDPSMGLSPSNPLMTEHADGSFGHWGNQAKIKPEVSHVRQFGLTKSAVSPVQQVGENDMNRLRSTVTGFDYFVGKPQGGEGDMKKFGPEQSDLLRKLLLKYPAQQAQPQLQQGQAVPNRMATMATGGQITKAAEGAKVTPMKYGSIKDSDTKKLTPQGQRNDSGKKEHTAVGGNGSLGKGVNKGNGQRKDSNKKETAPGKKDWMDKGNSKKEHTAVVKLVKRQQGGTTPQPKATALVKKKNNLK